jgi:hypothetical protein
MPSFQRNRDGPPYLEFLDLACIPLNLPLWTLVLSKSVAVPYPRSSSLTEHQYDHPEGVSPHMTPVNASASETFERLAFFNGTVQECAPESFHEMTGKVGDVILLHPLMLHSASKNGLRNIRIITNPPVSLLEPFDFSRGPREDDYSLVELKTIKELGGIDKLKGWKINGERREVIPERVRLQAKMMEEENRRLKESGREYAERIQAEEPAGRLQAIAAV